MSDDATGFPLTHRAGERRKVLPASCELEHGPEEPTSLVVSTRAGMVKLNPQIAGSCVITLQEEGACALRDKLSEWFR